MYPHKAGCSHASGYDKGFTLLEVLVALAILAIALAAIVKVSANQALSTEHLRNKTLAHWVAMNQIAQLQLTQQWPKPGKKRGTEEMGLHKWHWQSVTASTPDERVRQIMIEVYHEREDESPVTQLTSFIAQPK